MAKRSMDLTEFVGKVLAESDVDVLREGVRVLAQAFMDSEVTAQLGAEPVERTPSRTGHRNGFRDRHWDTRVGTIEPRIPKVTPDGGPAPPRGALPARPVGGGRGGRDVRRARLRATGRPERLREVVRTNRYDPAAGTLTLDPVRGEAFEALAAHYARVFAEGRDAYAIPAETLTDPVQQRHLATFFFGTSWAASPGRPGTAVSYTQNWPHERLVGNTPSPGRVV